jgi:hypothetical protein
MSRWTLAARELESGIWEVQVWRLLPRCPAPVIVGRAVGKTAVQAAQRARRATKLQCSSEPWCWAFAEKQVQAALARGQRRSWANL